MVVVFSVGRDDVVGGVSGDVDGGAGSVGSVGVGDGVGVGIGIGGDSLSQRLPPPRPVYLHPSFMYPHMYVYSS